MYEELTEKALHTLIVSTFEKIAVEKSKSIEKIKHFIFAHENKRLLLRFWELIDVELPGHQFEYLGCHPQTGLFEVIKIPPCPPLFSDY